MLTKQDLKAEAARLGFVLCGVTSAATPHHFAQYAAWIEAGRHAGMHYLATPRAMAARANPQRLLPGCQTILVLAAAYPAPDRGLTAAQGQTAAYARSIDYHTILPPRLEALAKWIADRTPAGLTWRAFTDTAPILEKELAQRAGLGWIGKNTCLIHPHYGSWFFLAELFLDIALEPDLPFTADRCGTCQRCIEACPTGCILLDRSLDANRCISYLTIENKGDIPDELRPRMGDHIFGCDICQTVCPWNQQAQSSPALNLFPPLPDTSAPDLVAALNLDDAGFRDRFRHTPLWRAKRHGYLRNVAVALGNTPRAEAIPALADRLLQDPEPLVRAHAAWALGHHRPAAAAQAALYSALQAEIHPDVKAEIQQALTRFSSTGNGRPD